MPGSNVKNMQDSNISNGTSTTASDMTSTNNTSPSVDVAGVASSNNGDRGSEIDSAHIQRVPVTGSSGTISSGLSFSNSTGNHRANDSAQESIDATMESQSSWQIEADILLLGEMRGCTK